MSLSFGAIKTILNGSHIEKPQLLITNLKCITNEGVSKIRLMLTDGELNHSYVLLSGSLTARVQSGEIVADSLIRLDNYETKVTAGKHAIIIADLTVISIQNIENFPPVTEFILNAPVARPIKLEAVSSVSSMPIKLEAVSSVSSMPIKLEAVSSVNTIPINRINPYTNEWTIKGRVVRKDGIRTWSNFRGEGNLFSFVMIDDSCDIQVTAFNLEVDKFYDLIKAGRTYTLSNAAVKVANQQYNRTKNIHQLILQPDSEISEVADDLDILSTSHEFVNIAHIKDHSPKTMIDIIGVAHEMKEVMTIVAKASRKVIIKRDIILVDRSGCSISLTLWAEDVAAVDNLEHPVVVVRRAFVNIFGGRSLSAGGRSTLLVNPGSIPEAHSLLDWYQDMGHNLIFENQSINSVKKFTIEEFKNIWNWSDYYNIEAVVAKIMRKNLVYKACEKCNKKMEDLNNGLYSCVKCGLKTPDFKYRLLLKVDIKDKTGEICVTAFHEVAEKLLRKTGEEVGMMVASGDEDAIDRMIYDVLYIEDRSFSVYVRNVTFNQNRRREVTLHEYESTNEIERMSELFEELYL